MNGEDIPLEDDKPSVGRWEYYEILGVTSKDITLDELRKKRKRLALRYHPDKNQNDETAQVYHHHSTLKKTNRSIYKLYFLLFVIFNFLLMCHCFV